MSGQHSPLCVVSTRVQTCSVDAHAAVQHVMNTRKKLLEASAAAHIRRRDAQNCRISSIK
eukprot:17681-Heterococcus_DN1.PRE.2